MDRFSFFPAVPYTVVSCILLAYFTVQILKWISSLTIGVVYNSVLSIIWDCCLRRQLHIREQDTPKLDYDEAFNILRSKGQLASFKIEANRKYGLLAALALGKIQPVHYLTHCEEVKLRETRVSVVDPKHFPKKDLTLS